MEELYYVCVCLCVSMHCVHVTMLMHVYFMQQPLAVNALLESSLLNFN